MRMFENEDGLEGLGQGNILFDREFEPHFLPYPGCFQITRVLKIYPYIEFTLSSSQSPNRHEMKVS